VRDCVVCEARALVRGSLVTATGIPVRGFRHRGDAFMQAVREVQANDARTRAQAESEVKRDYGLKKMRARPDDRDAGAFWQMVHEAVAPSIARTRKGRRR
jgi:hypothetical protein